MGSCCSCCIALSSLDNEWFCLVLLYLYHIILCSVDIPGRPPQRRSEFERQGRWKGDWRVGKQKLRCTESKSVFKNQMCHANSLLASNIMKYDDMINILNMTKELFLFFLRTVHIRFEGHKDLHT